MSRQLAYLANKYKTIYMIYIPKGRWVEAHLTCLVFVFAHFGAAPGFKWRPFVL